MGENAPDTSRISITAHHTGYTWYAYGLSHKALTTARGAVLYKALSPLMKAGRAVFGLSDIETYLVQRHLILDHLMDREVREHGTCRVLELACGLSPRGMRFCDRHRNLDPVYVEADLPGMAARKQRLLSQNGLLRPGHTVAVGNILAGQGPDSIEELFAAHFSRKGRTIVVTEGIVNYFPLPTVLALWGRIAALLARSGGGLYLCDNMPEFSSGAGRRFVRPARRMVELAARGRTHLHFAGDAPAERALLSAGFSLARVHCPEDFFSTLPVPRSRQKSFIRVLEASVP